MSLLPVFSKTIIQEREEKKKIQKLQRDMEKVRMEDDRKEREMRDYKLMDNDPETLTSNHFDNESDAERELVDDFM